MPLPTLAKTWLYNVNQLFATTGTAQTDHQQLLLGIKNSLKGFTGGWTHVASSNQSSTSTSSDQWSSNGDLRWAPAGSAHSWIVLKQTGLASNFQLLIDLNSPNADEYWQLTLKISPSVGFTGGTTANAPTASDSVTVIASTESWLIGGPGFTVTARLHAWQSTDGQCTRVAVYVNGVAALFWIIDKAAAAPSAWSVPVIAGASRASASSSSVMRFNDWWASSSWLKGCTSAGSMNAYLTCEGFANAGLGQSITVASELDGAWPFSPAGLVSTTAGSRGRLGTINDLWYGSTAVGEADTYPDDSSKQFVQFGHLILPWNGTTPQTA